MSRQLLLLLLLLLLAIAWPKPSRVVALTGSLK
jgi:hypothetical protein